MHTVAHFAHGKIVCINERVYIDPACGSGNFLTETYLSLRRLENEAITIINGDQAILDAGDIIKVSIGQFYGIEINDFAVTVARTALWIAESQMMRETAEIVKTVMEFLPLKSNANIVEGNALRLDWESIVPKAELNYIMGNPPFVGQSLRSKEQINDMNNIFGAGSIETKLDYVICWYKKAIDLMNSIDNCTIKAAFVSTNSICQGESVPTFWKMMIDNKAHIEFAYTSFVWDSEAPIKAHVHVVIVCFSNSNLNTEKLLFESGNVKKCEHINPYLYSAPDIWITNRINNAKTGHSKMTTGSPPTDDGGLLLTFEEKEYFVKKYQKLEKYIKPFIGAKEFLHDKMGTYSRYCFWFQNANPADFSNNEEIKIRLRKVKELRLSSNADRIQKMADYPYLFCQIRQPKSNYLVFPRHSSENREYIPIGFVTPDVIAGDACSIIPDVSLYEFGILTSNVHMAWTKVVCGRIKSDYRYSPAVYNNFPWCTPSAEQKAKIEQTAQSVLDARAKFPDSSLADLYDELTMPPELRSAHRANDKAVMQAYGFDPAMSEQEIVAELMKMYRELVEG